MRNVLVRRLSLRVGSGHLAASRQRVEDGLFLAAPDETRLVLLRRLDSGSVVAARARRRLGGARDATTGRPARAGGPRLAAGSRRRRWAVWFHSIHEARELLLLLLAAGRHPSAWFWRLAVPEWRGLPLPRWLEERVAAALAEPAAEVALARALIAAARAGALPAVLDGLVLAMLPEPPAPEQQHVTASAMSAPRQAATLAPVLLARLDAGIDQVIFRALAELPARSPHARWLARLTLVAMAPELAGLNATLAELAERVVAEAHARGGFETDAAPTTDGSSAPTREATDRTPRARAHRHDDAAPQPRPHSDADLCDTTPRLARARRSRHAVGDARRAASTGTRARRIGRDDPGGRQPLAPARSW